MYIYIYGEREREIMYMCMCICGSNLIYPSPIIYLKKEKETHTKLLILFSSKS